MAIPEMPGIQRSVKTIADYDITQSKAYALNQTALEELLKMGRPEAIPPHTQLFKVQPELPVLLKDPTFWVPPSKPWALFQPPPEYFTRRRTLFDARGMSVLFGSTRKQQLDLQTVNSLSELNDAQGKQKGVVANFLSRLISKNLELEHIWGNMGRFRQA